VASPEKRLVKIIFNPASRKSRKKVAKVEKLLRKYNLDYQIFETTAPLDGISITEQVNRKITF